MKSLLAAATIAAIGASPALAQPRDCGPLPAPFAGVAFVGDGDTIYGVGYRPPLRLWGMNAPELRRGKTETIPGMRARAFVADKLSESDHQVQCAPIEWDRYCRAVSTCITARGVDLTLATLREGLAFGYYLAKHPSRIDTALAYAQAETEARHERRGLWSAWLPRKN